MLIEVSEIHPTKIGGKVSRIVAADGERYEFWPDKLAGVVPGERCEVDIKERQYNERTIRSITKIVPAAPPATDINGPEVSYPGEAEFVGRVLGALIIKSEIGANHIAKTTTRLRQIWRLTDPAARLYREEAEQWAGNSG
jgi:hypothetical protein